jgi:pantetheine-phosphate adenylyltransferase
MAMTNRSLAERIETVFLMPSLDYSFTSSSLIKEIARNGGDVSAFLPDIVVASLRNKT